MKKYIIISLFAAISASLCAQNEVKIGSATNLHIQNGATFFVQGSVNLDNGSTINNNGTIVLQQNANNATANWTDNTAAAAAHAQGTGTISLEGTNGHSLSSLNRFGKIAVKTPDAVTLQTNITAEQWHFDNGLVQTNANYAIVNSNASTAVSAATANLDYSRSWVAGQMRRNIAANTDNYTFPVGKVAQSNSISFINNNLTGVGYIDAQFTNKLGTDAGLTNAVDFPSGSTTVPNEINAVGVWNLTPNATPTGGSYDLNLSLNGFSGHIDNKFTIVRRNDVSTNAADWIAPIGSFVPTTSGTGALVADNLVRRTNLTTFSQFGLAQYSTTLPIKLLAFWGDRSNGKHVLQWITAQERNASHFEIEQSSDAINFKPIGTVQASNNSNISRQYKFINPFVFAKNNYYRLKMIDFDGSFEYSNVILLVEPIAESTFSAYPNPFEAELQVLIAWHDKTTETLNWQITDMLGRIVLEGNINDLSKNSLQTITIDTHNLAAATYFLTVTDNKRVNSKAIKIIKL